MACSWVALVVAGGMKITYDLGLLITFGNMKIGDEDQKVESRRDSLEATDEEY